MPDISNVVAGVQPATLAVFNPLRPGAGARTVSSRGRPAIPIVNSTLPNVTRADFDAYIAEITPEWQRSKRGLAQNVKGNEAEPEAIINGSKHHFASAGHSKQKSAPLPALDVVPDIFHDETFDLADPRIFEAVTQRTEGAEESAGIGDLAADQIIQEKLSHYLDTVELHLSSEISLRSSSFFSALTNLQSLHSQSAHALQRIESLKKELGAVDEAIAQTGLRAVRAGVKRRRLESVTRGIESLREMGRAVGQATQLAEAGEWESALGLIDEVEGLVTPPTADPAAVDALGISVRGDADTKTPATTSSLQLYRLKATKGMPNRLARLRTQVAKALESEAIAVLSDELEDTVTAYQRTLDPPFVWQPESKLAAQSRIKSRLRPIVRGLLRCGWSALDSIVVSWKNSLVKTIRQCIRNGLPEGAADIDDALNQMDLNASAGSKSAGLSKTMRSLRHPDFLAILRKITFRLAAVVDVSSAQSGILFELIEESSPADSADVRSGLSVELADMVHACAEIANLRLSKVIAVRDQLHAQLSLPEFVELFTESWAFVVHCETACQRMIVGLRGVLVSQAKAFLQAFHQGRVSESARHVEVEQWAPVEIPSSLQTLVDDVVSGAVKDQPAFVLTKDGDKKTPEASMQPKEAAKTLIIEDRGYFAVNASLRSLEALADYVQVVINLPLLATDAMSRIVEFLKQFNSRTCQVVLGAGAMRSAGLKNITAKHLALASQSLSIMIVLVPYVRETLRRHLSVKQATMLTEFDKLKRDYQEHQYEIHAKLIAIMNDRLQIHCKALQSIDWTEQNVSSPKSYMETLVKETMTLHKVLFKYLQSVTLDHVVGQVIRDIYTRLRDEYSKIELRDVDAKDRLLNDAKYLRSKISELKGLTVDLPGTELEDMIQSMPTVIQPSRPPSPVRPPTPPADDIQKQTQAIEEPTTSSETSKSPTTTSPVVSSAEITRSTSSTVMRNRLAGLFGKRGSAPTSPEIAVAPTVPDAHRTSVDLASSASTTTEKDKGKSFLADRLAALTGGSPGQGAPSVVANSPTAPSAPEMITEETEAVDDSLVAMTSDAAAAEEVAKEAEDPAPSNDLVDPPVSTAALDARESPAAADVVQIDGVGVNLVVTPNPAAEASFGLQPHDQSSRDLQSAIDEVIPSPVSSEQHDIDFSAHNATTIDSVVSETVARRALETEIAPHNADEATHDGPTALTSENEGG